MAEYIERSKLMDHIELNAREHEESYDAWQILGDVEDFPAADVIEVGSCDGCHWKGMGRFQKCTYCRRNRNLKDRFEERRGDDATS